MIINTPYKDKDKSDWFEVTRKLVEKFPLKSETICSVVNAAWEDIYSSSIGGTGLKIGKDIFLPAQATGVILEKLISIRLSHINKTWRAGTTKSEKDVVNSENNIFSFEIKTSSSKAGLYGNRSTGHISDNRKKNRTGYYLVINYKLPKEDDLERFIYSIRFGWIDDDDWIGQAQPTGQQASIGVGLARLKLITLLSNT